MKVTYKLLCEMLKIFKKKKVKRAKNVLKIYQENTKPISKVSCQIDAEFQAPT